MHPLLPVRAPFSYHATKVTSFIATSFFFLVRPIPSPSSILTFWVALVFFSFLIAIIFIIVSFGTAAWFRFVVVRVLGIRRFEFLLFLSPIGRLNSHDRFFLSALEVFRKKTGNMSPRENPSPLRTNSCAHCFCFYFFCAPCYTCAFLAFSSFFFSSPEIIVYADLLLRSPFLITQLLITQLGLISSPCVLWISSSF